MGLSSLAVIMGIIDQLYSIDHKLQHLYGRKRELAATQSKIGMRQGRIHDFITNRETRILEDTHRYIDQISQRRDIPEERKQQLIRIAEQRARIFESQSHSQQQRATRHEEMLLKVGMQHEARLDQEIQQLQAKRKTLETQMQQLQQYVNKGIQRAFSDAFGR